MRVRRRTIIIAVAVILLLVVFNILAGGARDGAATGSRAYDYASGPFVAINVEVSSQVALSAADMNRYADFMGRYTGKLINLQVSPLSNANPDVCTGGILNPASCTYSDANVVSIERSSRTGYSGLVGWIALHVVVLSGRSASDPSPTLRVAGFTISATSFVMFPSAIPSGFIPAVMAHESAHLMGLMCITYDVSLDAKCDGSGHSKDTTSLMAPQLNTQSTWVANLQLQPNEVYDLQHYVTNRPGPNVGVERFYVGA
jgi:hypothetical protein